MLFPILWPSSLPIVMAEPDKETDHALKEAWEVGAANIGCYTLEEEKVLASSFQVMI